MGGSITGSGGTSIDTSWMPAQPRMGRPLDFNTILNQGQQASDQLWRSQLGYMGDIQSQLAASPYNAGAIQAINRGAIAEGEMSNAGLAMTNAELAMGAAEGRMQGAEGRMQGAEGAMQGAEGRMQGAEGAMQGAEWSMQGAEGGMQTAEARLGGLADMQTAQANAGWMDTGPTGIEQQLYNQGARELALGQSLSPEEQRQATQAARAAMATRGLATSNAGTAAEILNRDAYGRARQDARRSFAASANNLLSENVRGRRQTATDMTAAAGTLSSAQAGVAAQRGQLAGQRGQLAGQRGQLAYQGGQLAGQRGQLAYQGGQLAGQGGALAGSRGQLAGQRGQLASQRGGLALQGASQLAAIDPIAMSWGLAGGVSNNTVGSGLDYSGSLGSFNTNRADSLYTNWMNNQAGVSSAQAQIDAANQAAMLNFWGGLGSAALQATGTAIGGGR
jgi:hypothetical protein